MEYTGLVSVVLWVAVSSDSVGDIPWWRRTNFYQVYPRSFKDSNGDGTGDIRGIAQKAQYFKDIGVDAIWLSPFFTSPMKDFGYDVSDFKNVDPIFGNMDDFRNLSKTLENLGVKLVIDYVPNHTSDLHPWFLLSCNRTPPYTDYFVWVNGTTEGGKHHPPNNWMSVFGGSAWEWHEGRQQFYYHAFLKEQPDLNFNNPAARAAMEDVIRYWLDIGVDGFRLDSANYMFESDNIAENETLKPGITDPTQWKNYLHNLTQNQEKTYELFNDWGMIFYNYSIAKGGKPRALFLEVYTDLNNTLRYYGHGNLSLMFPFNFELLINGNQSIRASGFKWIIESWLNGMPKDGVANWVVGNHDNGRVANRYGFEMVDAINLLTGVLPGVKVTYYGDEIGLRNTFIRWDQNVDPSGTSLGPYRYLEASRDPERAPMQWDSAVSAGFSSNRTTWLPVNPDYWWLNVQQQMKADSSHLKVFQALAKERRDAVLLEGNCIVLAPDDDTLIILRSLNASYFALLINLGSEVRLYTSRDLPVAPTIDAQVVITSMNVVEHKIGALFLEVYTDLNNTLRYYGHGNLSLMFPFNFELLINGNQSIRASGFKWIIESWLNGMPKDGVANWVVGNHDNGRVANRYGFEMVDAINLLTGVLPGVKVTYYGDEIGLRNTFIRWDQNVDPSGTSLGPYRYLEASRDPERAPMQWDSAVSAGFSSNRTTWLPVNPDYWWLNVQQQMKADSSHLKVFQALAKERRDAVLLEGNCIVLAPDDDTLIILRSLNASYFALLINLGSEVRLYTSRDLPVAPTIDAQVVITSMNVVEHKIGDRLSANITLRPKGAILLRSVTSSAMRLLLSLPLLLCVVLGTSWR